ncbi:MAG: ATP-binding protein [Chloroflexota bacterium]
MATNPDPTDVGVLNAAVVAERDRLAQIVDVLPVGVVMMDRLGKVTLENRMTRDLFQRNDQPAPGLTGRLAGTLRRADGSPYEMADVPIARSLRGEEVRGEMVRYTRADGRHYDLLTNSAPIRDASGAVAGAIAAYEDVTALESAERERTAFFGAASHELKTPLTAIRGMVQLAQRFHGRAQWDLVGSTLERCNEQTRRMAALIDDLLDAARIDLAQFDVVLAPLDPAEAVASCVAALRPTAGDRSLRVELPDEVAVVNADRRRLEQLLDNLISNAIRHGGAGEVVVSLNVDDGRAVLRVRDHGPGIPEAERGRLFERFYRTSAARSTPGTGLGLYVSREIARLLDGELALETSGPSGTVFRFSMPLMAGHGTR